MLDPNNLDFDELGFHAGLEVHHQINSKRKLFCYCPPELIPCTTEPDYRFERYFRPVLGEMGDYDPGMLIEFEKGYRCIYHAFEKCDCIYEQDEQPPFWPDMDTIKNAYQLAHWFNMSALVDEIIFARKQYLDGSITTGFQRTAIVARDGYVNIDGKKIQITNLTVEEDAARRFRTENYGRTIYYNLDRLGVPLVEVITEHTDVDTPQMLVKLARMIGITLRLSGIGRRGLGSARQDVNISIKGGDRVELKGVQDIGLIEKWCRHEVLRQFELIKIAKDLNKRFITKENLEHTYIELSDNFLNIPKGFVIMGIRLPQFGDIFNREIQPGKDFGMDVMEKATLITGVPIHYMFFSHEIKKNAIRRQQSLAMKDKDDNYFFNNIDIEIDEQIREKFQLNENDAYFLAIHSQKWVIHTLKKIIERAKIAFDGVPQETRRATLDGNSEFLRVIHGKERLYPDTDTPVIDMKMDEIYSLKENVKDKPWELEIIFKEKYNLSFDNLETLIRHNNLDNFQWLVNIKKLKPKAVYNFLENTLINLKRHNLPIHKLNKEIIFDILYQIEENNYDLQLIPEICKIYLNNCSLSIEEAIKKLKLKKYTNEDIDKIFLAASERYSSENGNHISNKLDNISKSFKINKITGYMMQQTQKVIPGNIINKYVKEHILTE